MLTARADEMGKVIRLKAFRQVRDGLRQGKLHCLEEMEDSAAKGECYVTATENL